MNKKVLILSNNHGGLYLFRKEVVKALIDNGYELVISTPFSEGSETSINYFKSLGCRMVDIDFERKGTNPLADIKQIWTYINLIKKEKPFVVLSYTIKPNLYGGIACALCRVPQLANVTGLGTAVENPGKLQKLTIALYRLSLRRVHTVFFQNKANMDFCLKHKMIRKNSEYLIPGSGVNLQWHSLKPYPEEGKTQFLYIGRVMTEKGIDQFIDAAKAIRPNHPDTEFVIMGHCEDDYHDTISSLHKDGIVTYVGTQFDVRPFIENSTCTIHPSYYPEGMSNVLLETCAAGRPVITTNRPGCGEIVEDGVTGLIVKQKDSADLIEKIEKFLAMPYEHKKAMGLAARAKVERDFDRQIIVNAYLSQIGKIAD